MSTESPASSIAYAMADYQLASDEFIVRFAQGQTRYGRIVTSYFKAVAAKPGTAQLPDPATRRELVIGVDSNSGQARICDATEWQPFAPEVYGPD